jgi:molybdate transport system substrate-binding protein
MNRFLYLTLLLALSIAGCTSTVAPSAAPALPPATEPEPGTLNIFAAASLTDAFAEIGVNFEAANPGVTVTFNFAGSQALRTQIEEGAPADVFASANTKEMDTLVAGAFVANDAPQMFLTNELVIIVPEGNPAGVDNVESLSRLGLKLVLAAEEVPVGRYSREAFDLMNAQFGSDFKDKVLANVVSNEDNVKQVVAKVQLGEADAGIVYTSDAVPAPELPVVEIPAEMNVIAEYPIAPLTAATNPDLAAAFVEYVLAPEGQAVLQKWGFGPVP